jgi:hypothetical protein
MDAATFQRTAGNFGVDWAVKFYEAPIDSVSDAYARFRKCDVARDVSIVTTAGTDRLRPPTGVIIQPANTAWTLVLHSWDRFPQYPVLAGLNTKTIEFGGSDGSRAHTCNFFAPSKPITIVRYRIGSVVEEDNEIDDVSRTSKSSRPKVTLVSSYASVFERYHVKLAFVYLDESRQVVMEANDRTDIVRVDVAAI